MISPLLRLFDGLTEYIGCPRGCGVVEGRQAWAGTFVTGASLCSQSIQPPLAHGTLLAGLQLVQFCLDLCKRLGVVQGHGDLVSHCL